MSTATFNPDPWIDSTEIRRQIPVSPTARKRWEKHPDPKLRFPKGVRFTPGGRLFWKQSEIDAWQARCREHAWAQQFDPDELPIAGWPTARATLEAKMVWLRDENAAQRAVFEKQLAAKDAEIMALRDENAAQQETIKAHNVELCRERTPPAEEVEEAETESAR